MANVNFADIWWGVRAELPGVPVPLLYAHFSESVREFLAKSLAWQYNCPNLLNLGASTAWPTLVAPTDIPTGSYVVQPVKLKWADGTDIPFVTRDQLDKMDGDWEAATGGEVEYWTITGPSTWRVYPLLTSAVTSKLRLRVALATTAAGGVVPEELANEHRATWEKGALARLLRIPGKDWTNPRASQMYQFEYEKEIAMAKSRAAADYGRPQRVVEYGGLSIGGSGRRINTDYGK